MKNISRILARRATKRRWGEKREAEAICQYYPDGDLSAEPVVIFAADFWDGPSLPGEEGRFERIIIQEKKSDLRKSTCSYRTHLLGRFKKKKKLLARPQWTDAELQQFIQ